MTLGEAISLTGVFLTASSILAVALATARNQELKSGIGAAGALVTMVWILAAMIAWVRTGECTAGLLVLLPMIAALGWAMALYVHLPQAWPTIQKLRSGLRK